MPRYIDLDILQHNELWKRLQENGVADIADIMQALQQAAEQTPEVAAIVRARWIKEVDEFGVTRQICPNCGHCRVGLAKLGYCAVCGAILDQ